MCTEIELRKSELDGALIKTIYFGGGTPSVCSVQEINQIIETIYSNYKVSKTPEITLEANPDDLSEQKINDLASTKINRLSIGVQSFFEEDLQLMNRAHNADEALHCLEFAKKQFSNISIDLIYGIPGMNAERWQKNLSIALALELPHISSYALTVEKNTALEKFIQKGVIAPPSDASAEAHYQILTSTLEKEGYVNYEFSNFGKPTYFSQNNTAYWQGEKYIGIGPSAHSFNGEQRSWNVANNALYLKGIQLGKRNFEVETLSNADRFNEYIMTGLRTIWGVSLLKVLENFGNQYLDYLHSQSKSHLQNGFLKIENEQLHLTKKGKFLGDGIASDLFFIN